MHYMDMSFIKFFIIALVFNFNSCSVHFMGISCV